MPWYGNCFIRSSFRINQLRKSKPYSVSTCQVRHENVHILSREEHQISALVIRLKRSTTPSLHGAFLPPTQKWIYFVWVTLRPPTFLERKALSGSPWYFWELSMLLLELCLPRSTPFLWVGFPFPANFLISNSTGKDSVYKHHLPVELIYGRIQLQFYSHLSTCVTVMASARYSG